MIQRGRFFENFRLGERIIHATPRTLTEGDVSAYLGLTGSRFVLQCALPVAQLLGFPSCPIDDMLVFNIAFGKTVPDISYNALANLGYAEVRFLKPVFVGDTLFVTSQVIGLRENKNGHSGIVYVHSRAHDQNQDPVLEWTRWVMVKKRQPQSPAPTGAGSDESVTAVPDLAAQVPADTLSIPAFIDYAKLDPALSGSSRMWDDYRPGEQLDHGSGSTINTSGHSFATHLYQNTARVHFDASAMQSSQFGQRLVYGGHIMSLCRAMSFNGLENALHIVAINAGTHNAPCFAGDTLYATSEIIEKIAITGRSDAGLLRLRTQGFKQPKNTGTPAAGKGKSMEQVLDWDYTVLLPRS